MINTYDESINKGEEKKMIKKNSGGGTQQYFSRWRLFHVHLLQCTFIYYMM